MKTKPKILVVGSINIDLVLRTERVPKAGESFLGEEFDWVPGGKGANQAVAAARAGADVGFAGRVGRDENGRHLAAGLLEAGVSDRFVTVDEEKTTGMAVIMVEKNGENRIIVFPGANLVLSTADVDRAVRDGGPWDAVLLSFEISEEVISYTAARSVRDGIPLYVDAGPARDAVDLDTLKGAAVISPNRGELEILTGRDCSTEAGLEDAARYLRERSSAEAVVVKLGDEGALLSTGGGGTVRLPAFPVRAVDTTAAGDAFTAGLAVRRAAGSDLDEAVRYGCAAGALAVTAAGAQPSLPHRDEVDRFLSTHG
jgi:ribokinase